MNTQDKLAQALRNAFLAGFDASGEGFNSEWGASENRISELAEEFLKSALAEHEAQAVAVPQGWKLVPVEPTPEMMRKAFLVIESEGIATTPWLRRTLWDTMLAAAPQPQADTLREAALAVIAQDSGNSYRVAAIEELCERMGVKL